MEKGDGKRKKHNLKQTNKQTNKAHIQVHLQVHFIGSGPYCRILVLQDCEIQSLILYCSWQNWGPQEDRVTKQAIGTAAQAST